MRIIGRVLAFASVTLLAAFVAGCVTSRPKGSTMASDYLAFIAEHPGADLSGEEEKAAIRRFEDYLAHFSEASVRQNTRKTYAANAFLNDTLKTVRGSAAIEEYFLKTLANTESMRVEFTDVARSGNDYYFRWIMDIKFRQFNKGRVVRTVGLTHVRFNKDGQVILHQDYWDSAQGFFEYVPVIGGGIRFIKSKI